MKVVLFCGGQGMRIRDYSESMPKPMINIGYRPVLWHVMKYYAHFGHRDFVLCLGWKANVIKDYFLNYNECLSNDFVLTRGGQNVDLLNSDIDDWNITFCDTGASASIGERLLAVQPHVAGEETFLANYTDGLSDVSLPNLIQFHQQNDSIATLLSVRPTQSFHRVGADASGRVREIESIREADVWMNGGYFVFSNEIFRYLRTGEDMVDEAFHRLIRGGNCYSWRHEGFWGCMDTYKELQMLQDMYERGDTPWAVWESKQSDPDQQTKPSDVSPNNSGSNWENADSSL